MRFTRPGRQEYEVMAEIVHEFRRFNADTRITHRGRRPEQLHPPLSG